MDSVTQAVLGATVCGAIAPPGQRRRALLAGAVLGTLPDLDVFIDYGDAVRNFTYHRGFSHSLFVLAPFAVLIWALLRRYWPAVAQAPGRWFAAIALALLTHPLLDAHTAYGTQLFWPLTSTPVMWGTVFIIDPLYTLPLLAAVVIAAFRPAARSSATLLRGGLTLSTLYLAWTWTAQTLVANDARAALASQGLENAPMFVTPTPFNTLLWRVVVQTPDGYLEALDSLLLDEGNDRFNAYTSDREALRAAGGIWAVARLRWFSRDFVKAEVDGDRLVLSDLRMGQEPVYAFRYVVARRLQDRWEPTPSERLPATIGDRRLGEVWERIWQERPGG